MGFHWGAGMGLRAASAAGAGGADQCLTPSASKGAPPKFATCRICLEQSEIGGLEQPCGCKGTMQWAHHACVQRWLNERPNRGAGRACEVCGQPFKGTWTDPPRRLGERLHLGGLARYLLWGAGPMDGSAAEPLGGLGAGLDADDWAALPMERRRYSSSAAWGATLLLTVFSFLLVRHLFRIVPVTGAQAQAPTAELTPVRAAAQAIEDISLTLLMLWLILRIVVLVMPCMAYMGARPGRPAWPQAAVPVSAEMQAAPTTPAAAVATDLEAGRGGGRPAAAPAAAAEGVPALVWPAAP